MKLYIIVLASLRAGLKAAQACHALRAFVAEHPELDAAWYATSNNLVVLQCDELPPLADALEAQGFAVSRFHEPDLGDALTAVAVEPKARRRLARLPLAA
jgi:hypothetical protein